MKKVRKGSGAVQARVGYRCCGCGRAFRSCETKVVLSSAEMNGSALPIGSRVVCAACFRRRQGDLGKRVEAESCTVMNR